MINRYSYYDKFTEFLLFVKVDENCNMQCDFCYQGDKKQSRMEKEEQFDNCFKNLNYIINKFMSFRQKEEYEYATLTFCFFGGEPTLNPKAITRICDYLINNFSVEVRNLIRMSITTNGVIFDENVKKALMKMKEVSINPVGALISTDNNKQAYDEHRKLIGSDKSSFEIVQKHIKDYQEFLSKINNKIGNYVDIATVLDTPKSIIENDMFKNNEFKDIKRTAKFLYFADESNPKYLENARIFLRKAYLFYINNCNKDNKEKAIDSIRKYCFSLCAKETNIDECHAVITLDSNGNINWCNKNKNFGSEEITQDKMREYVYDKDVDISHFECTKKNLKTGNLINDTVRPDMWAVMLSKFDPNVPIAKINIETNDYDLYDFIKYMVGSTKAKEREVYIKNPTEKIIKMCKELEINISHKPIVSDENNIFYVDEKGNLFFDETFKNNEDMILSNIKERHFMWIHTPTLLQSVNEFYQTKLLEGCL